MNDVYDFLVEDDGRKTLNVKNFWKRYWNDEIREHYGMQEEVEEIVNGVGKEFCAANVELFVSMNVLIQ